ncbi:MAG: zinc metallopeptidase [Gemmatimonadaceae bacterium]|nr:zinc metallopeptidase [Gemmatimonadaceae bacterium]
MRWTPGQRSDNLEDRRGAGGGRMGGRGLGLGGVVVLGVLSLVFGRNLFRDFGVDPTAALQAPSAAASADPRARAARDSVEEPMVRFVSFVLDSTQSYWQRQLGPRYPEAKLVLYRGATQTACGVGQSQSGPFYCPADQKVYIDLDFFDELKNRFGAPGDFAQAYVLAHEIGHHIQNVTGTERQVRQMQQERPDLANQLSVRMELQADCYAGVWGHDAALQHIIEPGDLEEGLAAAAAVGDDRLQKQTSGRVQPEAFTHGTSQQRMQWFKRGFDSGDPKACDSFGGR